MEWSSLLSSTVVAAVISGGVSIIGFRLNQAAARDLAVQKAQLDAEVARNLAEQKAKLDAEVAHSLAEQKAKLDAELLRRKAELDNPSRTGAENSLRILFDNPNYPQRSRLFSSIKKRIKGFNDDELRRILIGIGATGVRMKGDEEGWHLDE